MKYDLILAGVGGQGILSMAYMLDKACLGAGLAFKQAEVHGMAQRGGAVQSHLRISDAEIHSDLIPLGAAQLILSVEPLEAGRYLPYLAPAGRVISSAAPVKNIPDYPPDDEVLGRVLAMPGALLVDSAAIARAVGSPRAQNTVMLGAASPFLPLDAQQVLDAIAEVFTPKGEKIRDLNLRAFELGRACTLFQEQQRAQGVAPREFYEAAKKLIPEVVAP
jgi:indolepyruvate ferredoxin oxidoreductase beta subunit